MNAKGGTSGPTLRQRDAGLAPWWQSACPIGVRWSWRSWWEAEINGHLQQALAPSSEDEHLRDVRVQVHSVSLGVIWAHFHSCPRALSSITVRRQPDMHTCRVTCFSPSRALVQVTALTTCEFTKHFLSTHLG